MESAFPHSVRTLVPLAGFVFCGLNVLLAVVTAFVARSKDRSMVGWGFLALFLGLFAFFLLLCFPRQGEPFRTGNLVGVVVVSVLLLVIPVVLAVIGMLAAVAVPNFLEARIRSQVAVTHVDLRMLAAAVEAYRVDHETYPPTELYPGALTSPVAYMTSPPIDPFTASDEPGGSARRTYRYRLLAEDEFQGYLLWGVGPDRRDQDAEIEYDPTNGTASAGDIVRRGP